MPALLRWGGGASCLCTHTCLQGGNSNMQAPQTSATGVPCSHFLFFCVCKAANLWLPLSQDIWGGAGAEAARVASQTEGKSQLRKRVCATPSSLLGSFFWWQEPSKHVRNSVTGGLAFSPLAAPSANKCPTREKSWLWPSHAVKMPFTGPILSIPNPISPHSPPSRSILSTRRYRSITKVQAPF